MRRVCLVIAFVFAGGIAWGAAMWNPAIKQGVWGVVTLVEGDCIPTSAAGSTCQKSLGVARKVYILEPVGVGEMDATILKVKKRVIRETISNAQGFYAAALPAGRYSVFTEDKGQKYCNRGDGQGNMCLVEVERGVTRFDIQIDHATW